jgi:sterol desaturase/sphingolipid hydroxylase (fatty acid hydroxylase superfamily)
MSSLLNSEITIRLGCFVGILAVMSLWEILAPRRSLTTNKPLRWLNNLGLVFLNSIAIRVLSPVTAVGVALAVQSQEWGVFNNLAIPACLALVLAVLALDFAIYLQHVMFHAIPVLWRLHMVHHADLDFDVTTGLRFHTIEILLSVGIKCAAIVLLGASPLAVLIFEVLLNGTAMFNHSNVRLPQWLDRVLRLVVVTPDMHRVHHSVIKRETNSNFGFNLPWWDFLLGTYRDQPRGGHEGMVIGLSQFRDQRVERLPWMLLLPFVGKVGGYPINRDELHSELPSDQRGDDFVHGDLPDTTSQRSAGRL